MTPDDFRRIALSMPEAAEVYRRGQFEFRVERTTFGSLGGSADTVATLYLTSEQQSVFMHAAPKVFISVPGGRGRLGGTNVVLGSADEATVESAVEAAWRNAAPRSVLKRIDKLPPRRGN
jgi:hypothetical protein